MDLNKKLITLLCSIAVLAVLIVTTYVNAFKNNKFTCSRYILNTYLYILLAFIFITVMVLGLEYKNVDLRIFNYSWCSCGFNAYTSKTFNSKTYTLVTFCFTYRHHYVSYA